MFCTRLLLSDYKPNEWVVEKDLVYFYEGTRIVVPKGFITDLASIPRPLRGILNVNGKSRKPAVLHDYLYCSKLYERSVCDQIFYEALVSEGMNKLLAKTYWAGVRSGGWLYYNKREGLTKEDFIMEIL